MTSLSGAPQSRRRSLLDKRWCTCMMAALLCATIVQLFCGSRTSSPFPFLALGAAAPIPVSVDNNTGLAFAAVNISMNASIYSTAAFTATPGGTPATEDGFEYLQLTLVVQGPGLRSMLAGSGHTLLVSLDAYNVDAVLPAVITRASANVVTLVARTTDSHRHTLAPLAAASTATGIRNIIATSFAAEALHLLVTSNNTPTAIDVSAVSGNLTIASPYAALVAAAPLAQTAAACAATCNTTDRAPIEVPNAAAAAAIAAFRAASASPALSVHLQFAVSSGPLFNTLQWSTLSNPLLHVAACAVGTSCSKPLCRLTAPQPYCDFKNTDRTYQLPNHVIASNNEWVPLTAGTISTSYACYCRDVGTNTSRGRVVPHAILWNAPTGSATTTTTTVPTTTTVAAVTTTTAAATAAAPATTTGATSITTAADTTTTTTATSVTTAAGTSISISTTETASPAPVPPTTTTTTTTAGAPSTLAADTTTTAAAATTTPITVEESAQAAATPASTSTTVTATDDEETAVSAKGKPESATLPPPTGTGAGTDTARRPDDETTFDTTETSPPPSTTTPPASGTIFTAVTTLATGNAASTTAAATSEGVARAETTAQSAVVATRVEEAPLHGVTTPPTVSTFRVTLAFAADVDAVRAGAAAVAAEVALLWGLAGGAVTVESVAAGSTVVRLAVRGGDEAGAARVERAVGGGESPVLRALGVIAGSLRIERVVGGSAELQAAIAALILVTLAAACGGVVSAGVCFALRRSAEVRRLEAAAALAAKPAAPVPAADNMFSIADGQLLLRGLPMGAVVQATEAAKNRFGYRPSGSTPAIPWALSPGASPSPRGHHCLATSSGHRWGSPLSPMAIDALGMDDADSTDIVGGVVGEDVGIDMADQGSGASPSLRESSDAANARRLSGSSEGSDTAPHSPSRNSPHHAHFTHFAAGQLTCHVDGHSPRLGSAPMGAPAGLRSAVWGFPRAGADAQQQEGHRRVWRRQQRVAAANAMWNGAEWPADGMGSARSVGSRPSWSQPALPAGRCGDDEDNSFSLDHAATAPLVMFGMGPRVRDDSNTCRLSIASSTSSETVGTAATLITIAELTPPARRFTGGDLRRFSGSGELSRSGGGDSMYGMYPSATITSSIGGGHAAHSGSTRGSAGPCSPPCSRSQSVHTPDPPTEGTVVMAAPDTAVPHLTQATPRRTHRRKQVSFAASDSISMAPPIIF